MTRYSLRSALEAPKAVPDAPLLAFGLLFEVVVKMCVGIWGSLGGSSGFMEWPQVKIWTWVCGGLVNICVLGSVCVSEPTLLLNLQGTCVIGWEVWYAYQYYAFPFLATPGYMLARDGFMCWALWAPFHVWHLFFSCWKFSKPTQMYCTFWQHDRFRLERVAKHKHKCVCWAVLD